MALTKVHGGLDETVTTQFQLTSQMSDYALTNHTHTYQTVSGTVGEHSHSQYLTTAALSNHGHTQYLTTAAMTNHTHSNLYQPVGAYLTTAALSNHSHTDYINTTERGTVYYQDANNIVFGSLVSGRVTTVTASANVTITGGTFDTNHSHSNYINISQSGNIYFVNGNNVVFGSVASGNSTTITASANQVTVPNNIFFLDNNGHTFSSSNNGVSTFYWIKTS